MNRPNKTFKNIASSLHWKFYFPIALMSFILFLSLQYLWLPNAIQLSIDESKKHTEKNLTILGEGLVPLLLEFQLSNIYDNLDNLIYKYPTWIDIQLYDDKGVLIYPLDLIVHDKGQKDYVEINSPIKINDRIIGRLILVYNFKTLIERIKNQYNKIFLWIISALILLTMLIGLAIQYLVIIPLNELRRASKSLSQGDFSIGLDTLTPQNSEVGDLAKSFIEMKNKILQGRNLILSQNDELNSTKNKLLHINQHLEDIVATRTKDLKQQQQKIIAQSKLSSLGEVAGGIAHEINNPLASITFNLRVIKKLIAKGCIDVNLLSECTHDIDLTVEKIHKIVTGLRVLSRNNTEIQLNKVLTKDILDDVLSLYYEKLKLSKIDLEIIDPQNIASKHILCNRVPLSQVLVNLLNNAKDEIEQSAESWIKIFLSLENDTFYIKIMNSGPRIDNNIEDKIFQPFFTTKEIGRGTGVGLSLSKTLIEKQSGKLYLDQDSQSTCFVIEIPQQGIHEGDQRVNIQPLAASRLGDQQHDHR